MQKLKFVDFGETHVFFKVFYDRYRIPTPSPPPTSSPPADKRHVHNTEQVNDGTHKNLCEKQFSSPTAEYVFSRSQTQVSQSNISMIFTTLCQVGKSFAAVLELNILGVIHWDINHNSTFCPV